MKSNYSIRRKGFTLVELLIVIVVIGILSAMMMLSSTEAVTSARASNIVSNLRNLKTAALAYYVDHMDACDKSTFEFGTNYPFSDVAKYMNTSSSTNSAWDGYGIVGKAAGSWYIYYGNNTSGSTGGSSHPAIESGVQSKLAGRASSVGLCKTTNSSDTYVSGNTTVYMFVR